MNRIVVATCSLMAIVLNPADSDSYAQLHLDLETGLVFSGYNNVRIPNDTGTKISLSKQLETDPTFFFRASLVYSISDRHTIGMLVAPLRLEAAGRLNMPVRFEGEEFPANIELKSTYRFDSYRLRYRYDVHRSDKLRIGIGLTAKIRDAAVSLEGENKKIENTNTGFVPLLNFRIQWLFVKKFSLILDGDALAAPQGRAEDVIFALQYQPAKKLKAKIGYRILEGGADVDEVYNFAMLHYLVAGAIVTF